MCFTLMWSNSLILSNELKKKKLLINLKQVKWLLLHFLLKKVSCYKITLQYCLSFGSKSDNWLINRYSGLRYCFGGSVTAYRKWILFIRYNPISLWTSEVYVLIFRRPIIIRRDLAILMFIMILLHLHLFFF
jgi:hypothetical protein